LDISAQNQEGNMAASSKFRVLGLLVTLMATAFICWRLMPDVSAQKKDDRSRSANDVATSTDSQVENFGLIQLNARTIDVKSPAVQAERKSVEAFGGKRMHLVRFSGPIQGEWYKMLEKSGVEIVDYIPHYTYLVYGDFTSLQRVQAEGAKQGSPIEWDGEYKPEYRIQPSVYFNPKADNGREGLRSEQFEIQLYKDDAANKETLDLIDKIKTADVKGLQTVRHFVNFVVGLDENGIEPDQRAARCDLDLSIHRTAKKGRAAGFCARRKSNGQCPTPGDYLAYLAGKGYTQAQFDASNFAVDLTDSGVDNATPADPFEFVFRRSGDPTLASRFIYSRLEGTPHSPTTNQGCDGHGNLNASIIMGYVPTGGIFAAAPHADASGFRYGLGVAPFVKLGSSVIFDPDTFTSPNFPNLQARAYNDGSRISSNSWGSSSNSYTADAQSYDFLVRDAQPATSVFPTAGNQEMVIVFAAGNNGSGSNTVGAPSTGKNVITVGATEGVQAFGGADGCSVADTGADSANDIIGFSGRGPTSDGRKKPDIMLPGTHISGTVAQASNVSPVSGTGAQLACFNANGVCGGVGIDFFPAGQQWYTASSGTSHSNAGDLRLCGSH
jgi:hypothetical protein